MIQLRICRCVPLLVLGTITLLVGCDLPKRPPLVTEEVDSFAGTSDRSQAEVVLDTPGAAFAGKWETWEAYFVRNRQVGFAHIQASPTSSRASSDVRYELESQLYVNQGTARLMQRVTQVSTETNDGRLRSFDGVVRVGPATTGYSGKVVDGTLDVEMVRGAVRSTRTIPWSPTYRGLVAMEQSLRQRPMKKGEERTVKMLLPGQYRLATVRMRCVGKASIPLLDGELHELLEINCDVRAEEGQPTFSTIWTNAAGEVVRTHSPALQLIAYRTDQVTAQDFEGNHVATAAIPVTGELSDLSKSTRVGFKIKPSTAAVRANVDFEFPAAPGQYVRTVAEGVSQVLVSRESESLAAGFSASTLEPTEGDTAANSYMDFNDEGIRKFVALTLNSSDDTPRDVALELTRAVHQNISTRPNVRGFRKASGVAEYWIADTTEKAIFLAALLRARKIPARLVLGLQYAPGTPSWLEYHPWTIAFVDGDWIHLDPSEGGLAAADRLVLSTTSLASNDEFAAILTLLETMQIIKVEIVGHN